MSPGIQGPPTHWEKTAEAAACLNPGRVVLPPSGSRGHRLRIRYLDVGPGPCQVCHSCPHGAHSPASEADHRGLIMR